ncbi:hypothetical protein [Bradyrhizobium sp. Cp5.3]|uniref:hypothetical protein n=1 Tax=Bradyrhizobium sp. Cp5.3 TaxID=443598 RepID=UPI000686D7C4|nr:hypothetical protein [Bradyrhizobium sp. Cp5.3]
MPAARIITPPLSGRDRKHYARELHKAEVAYEHEMREAAEAHEAADRMLAKAHALDCIAWTTRQFIGGDEDPSPTIADAIHGRYSLLEVRCRHCRHTEIIDLTLVVWPRERPVHTIRRALYCGPCQRTAGRKHRPELIGLRPLDGPQPSAPVEAARQKKAR